VIDAPVIAIVDDDASIRRALHRLVQAKGYAVESFASARAFLDAVPHCRPACLVLDVHLNGSGFELQERLGADGLKIPIIFITAHDDDSTRRRLEKCGLSRTSGSPWTSRSYFRRSSGQSGRTTTPRATRARAAREPEGTEAPGTG
jgi:CheY-like chemotaxis protein